MVRIISAFIIIFLVQTHKHRAETELDISPLIGYIIYIDKKKSEILNLVNEKKEESVVLFWNRPNLF